MDAKDIKCLLECWNKHETMFSIIGFLVKHILEIVNFQIETVNLFPLTKILTNFEENVTYNQRILKNQFL